MGIFRFYCTWKFENCRIFRSNKQCLQKFWDELLLHDWLKKLHLTSCASAFGSFRFCFEIVYWSFIMLECHFCFRLSNNSSYFSSNTDFQSIELRLLAHMSGDRVLLKVFNNKDCLDVFVELASEWYVCLSVGCAFCLSVCNMCDFQSIELRLLAHMSGDRGLLKMFSNKDCLDVFVELVSEWYMYVCICMCVCRCVCVSDMFDFQSIELCLFACPYLCSTKIACVSL